MIRGTLALGTLGLTLVAFDPFQKTVIRGLVSLFPGKRTRILAVWQRIVARTVLGIVRLVGGARFSSLPRLPGEEGVLVVMNHQSLLDIPLVVAAFRGGFPRIVTRARYRTGKPLVSSMVRLYQYPVVGSGATIKEDLEGIQEAARTSETPLVIYPEGHRTRDGEIGPFKRAGLRALLEGRVWRVYLLVEDGLWKCSKLKDFILTITGVRGILRAEGPLTSPAPGEDMDGFIDEIRDRMVAMLADIREEGAPG
ncbi:lysophospholipid acyltransferase family protein [Gemmatimonadota bacterium]